jgi:hypothetical protein
MGGTYLVQVQESDPQPLLALVGCPEQVQLKVKAKRAS